MWRMQVVVDAFDQGVLASTCGTKIIDFGTVKESDLHDMSIPLQLQVTGVVCMQCAWNVHGVCMQCACRDGNFTGERGRWCMLAWGSTVLLRS